MLAWPGHGVGLGHCLGEMEQGGTMLSPHFKEEKAEARRGNNQSQVTELVSGIVPQPLEGRSLLVLGLPTPLLPWGPSWHSPGLSFSWAEALVC